MDKERIPGEKRTEGLIRLLAERICLARTIAFFTGAGISTESGIPDYRSQGGLWDQFRPVYFDEFMSSKAARVEYWKQRVDMEISLRETQPNKGHLALARMEKLGFLSCLITQNIDGLHQASGVPGDRIIELHGNARRIRCMSCSKFISWGEILERMDAGDPAPECRCGGYFKPDTISFGQAMPEKETRQAAALSAQSDVFVAVGSTLKVQPAASMPVYAKNSGAFLAIINLSETPLDAQADMVIRATAGPVLEKLSDLVCAGRSA